MVLKDSRSSAGPQNLQERIAAGIADPISEREREQLEEMRMIYIDRFGSDPRDG